MRQIILWFRADLFRGELFFQIFDLFRFIARIWFLKKIKYFLNYYFKKKPWLPQPPHQWDQLARPIVWSMKCGKSNFAKSQPLSSLWGRVESAFQLSSHHAPTRPGPGVVISFKNKYWKKFFEKNRPYNQTQIVRRPVALLENCVYPWKVPKFALLIAPRLDNPPMAPKRHRFSHFHWWISLALYWNLK